MKICETGEVSTKCFPKSNLDIPSTSNLEEAVEHIKIDNDPLLNHRRTVKLVKISPSKAPLDEPIADSSNPIEIHPSQKRISLAGPSQAPTFRQSALSSQASGPPSRPMDDGKYVWFPLCSRREFAYRTDFEKANDEKLAELKEEQIVERPVSSVQTLVYEWSHDPRVALYLSRCVARACLPLADPRQLAAFRKTSRYGVASIVQALDARLSLSLYGPIDYVTRRTSDLQMPPGYLYEESDDETDEANNDDMSVSNSSEIDSNYGSEISSH